MIGLSYTELLAVQDEAKKIRQEAADPAVRAAAERIIVWLDRALKRRKRQVRAQIKPKRL